MTLGYWQASGTDRWIRCAVDSSVVVLEVVAAEGDYGRYYYYYFVGADSKSPPYDNLTGALQGAFSAAKYLGYSLIEDEPNPPPRISRFARDEVI